MTSKAPQHDPKIACIVLDTNIWRSQLLLKTNLGIALLHYVRQMGARIGLPEIVEQEVKKQIVLAGEEAKDLVKQGLSTIEVLIGSRPDYLLPDVLELEKAVEERFREMESFLARVSFSLEHAKSALNMVNLELPPNSLKNQQ